MSKIVSFYLMILCLIITSKQGMAQDHKQQIQDTLEMFLAKNSLRKTHDDFWAEELIYTSSNGTRFGKAKIMSGFEISSDEQKDTESNKWSAQDVDVRLYGDIAVLAFKLFNHDANGDLKQRYLNTGTLVYRDGRWQAVAWQATRIPGDDEEH